MHTHTHIHTKITRRGKTKFSGGWEERRIMRRKIKKYILYVCVCSKLKKKKNHYRKRKTKNFQYMLLRGLSVSAWT